MVQQQNNMTWKKLAEQHPEYYPKSKKKRVSNEKVKYVCQCKQGHIFDYRDRIKFLLDDKSYAPCQGKCPVCGILDFSFIGNGTNIYPIKNNCIG